MTEQIREKRTTETRENLERPKKWSPATLLPDPEPEPGYTFHWVRLSTLNNPDPSNISAKLREHWEPVKALDQPKLRLMSNPNGRFPDGIEIGGLLLCKTPVEIVQQRNEYYQKIANSQMDSVDNAFMRQNNAKMPLFRELSTRTTIGKNQ